MSLTSKFSSSGGLPIASQAEAEAGTNNGKTMTPLRTAEAIAALADGGGGALVRGYGTLQGHTSAGAAATAPPNLRMDFVSNNFATFTLYVDGSSYNFTLSDTDPANGTIWLDATFNSSSVMAPAFRDAINALSIPGVTAYASNDGYDFMLLTKSTTGAASGLIFTVNTEPTAYVITGGGSGTDATSDSGAVQEVTLIPQSGVKSVLPVKISVFGDGALSGVTVEVALKVGGSYYPVAALINGALTYGEAVPANHWDEWVIPRISSALVARYVDTPPMGGAMTIFAVAEQIATA
ncbi:hypothetical protein [Prosthecobacter sp.]|jgi:hypothetical protein|uniref:hypothetical protein n=1 Tax=Prosthecobacter sp. TaxID=1965333 RepID=UPI0037C99B18